MLQGFDLDFGGFQNQAISKFLGILVQAHPIDNCQLDTLELRSPETETSCESQPWISNSTGPGIEALEDRGLQRLS